MSASLRISLLAVIVASVALPASAQGHVPLPVSTPQPVSPVRSPGRLPAPASVMWIAAHPDDEVLVAPLLARWCLEGHARCSLLTATRGESGTCLRPDGCLPDLASVRSAEAGASSQYFGANAILLSLKDGGGSLPPAWDVGAGGSPALVATVAGFIRAEAPELVLTFDPRHGTTCHPDHRAIAAAVLDAVKLLSDPPAVYLLETLLEVETGPLTIRFRPAASGALRFDANEPLVATEGPAWNAVTADMGRHPSQFDAAWLGAVSSTPAADRAVYFAPASSILQRPASPCP